MPVKLRSGQTLLEMVIAIGVITVSVFGTVGLIVTTIKAGRVSQNRVEAANFAREGIEAIRAARDSNYLRRDQNETEYNPNIVPPSDPSLAPVEWDDYNSPIPNTSDGSYTELSPGPISPGTVGTPEYYTLNVTQTGVNIVPCVTTSLSTPCNGSANDFFTNGTVIKDRSFTTGSCPGGPSCINYKFFTQLFACPGSNTCTNTRYYRVISITKDTETNATLGTVQYLDVVSTIMWKDRTGTKSLIAQERLYNWR